MNPEKDPIQTPGKRVPGRLDGVQVEWTADNRYRPEAAGR
jgi:hypothetical protein